jgi:hypothetical protein
MPSELHEALLFLFRNCPTLAPDLMRDALHADWLPSYTEARIESADLTELQPAEYRADLVVHLISRDGLPVHGIIVEVQLSTDKRKRFAWPSYVTNLRARLKSEASLLVVTADERTARWAATPTHIGGGNWFTPLVIGPAQVPEITDEPRARRDPELAVLSAMAHGLDADTGKAARIAAAAAEASIGLDENRARLYLDLVLASLSEAARRELQLMDPARYEYKSEFAKRYVAQGKLEGELKGRADLVVRLLTLRFGTLSDDISARIEKASLEELDAIGERLLTAQSLEEAVGTLPSDDPAASRITNG